MKDVDLGQPTSFLDHVFLGCTQRKCQTSKYILDYYRDMFESKIFAGATEKLLYSEKLGAHISSWSCDMEAPARECVDIVSWQTKQLSNYTKSQIHVLTIISAQKKNWDLLENCQKYALKLF